MKILAFLIWTYRQRVMSVYMFIYTGALDTDGITISLCMCMLLANTGITSYWMNDCAWLINVYCMCM